MDKELAKKYGIRLQGDRIGVRLISQGNLRVEADSSRNKTARAALDNPGAFQPVSRDDLEPQSEDYIYPVYRALSQTILVWHYIDLRREGVLEASVPFLAGQTVYTNHRWDVEGWIGAVEKAWWDKPEESGTPFSVPGINARMKLDWKVNPKIARGILMDPPALHSVSVTFWFRWEKSHPELDDRQFWTMLGEEVDGRPVLIVVAEILGYDEISFVYQGADPEAKIVLPDEGAEENQEESLWIAAEKVALVDIFIKPKPGGVEMDKKLKALMEKLGVDPESYQTPEAALDRALELAATLPQEPDPEVAALAGVLKEYQLPAKEAGHLITAGIRYRDKLISELKANAALVMCGEGEQLTEDFVGAFTQRDIKQLEKTAELFRRKAEKQFPLRCQKCGSTNISSRSSVGLDLEALEQSEEKGRKKSNKIDTGRIHG